MNWLQKTNSFFSRYKNIITLIFIGVLVLFILCLLRRKPKVITVAKDNSDLMAEVKHLRDVNARDYAILQQSIISREEADARAAKIAAELRIKPKTIQGVTVVEQRTDTVFKKLTTIIIKDTVYTLREKNPYVEILAEIGPKIGSIKYSSIDTLTITQAIKTPLIGRTTRTLYIQNKNPYNSIKQGYTYTVKEKKTILSIGPVISYDFLTKKPSIGIGLSYPLISIKR